MVICIAINTELMSFMLFEIYLQATSKFFDGLLGTLIEYNSSISEVEAPSVSVCPIEKKWLSGAKVKLSCYEINSDNQL